MMQGNILLELSINGKLLAVPKYNYLVLAAKSKNNQITLIIILDKYKKLRQKIP
jgi:hypothetical protein